MSSSDDERRGYLGEHADTLETDMSAYNRGRTRRLADDKYQQEQADRGGGGGGIILVMGAVAVAGGVFVVLPYIVSWAIALFATIIIMRILLPMLGAKADWGDAIIGCAIAFGAALFIVGLLIGAGMLCVALGGPTLTPTLEYIRASHNAGDMYAGYVAPGWYLMVNGQTAAIVAAIVWTWAAGRWLHRCLPETRLPRLAHTLLFGLIALATIASALFAVTKMLPGHFYHDYRDYVVEVAS